MKTVKEVMTPHAKYISPETSLLVAATLMRDLDVGSLPICEDNQIIGIVTDRDLAIRGLADGRDPESTPVSTIMSKEIACVFSDQDAEEAARLMEVKQVRRLPVINQEKQIVGIVSLGDLAVMAGIQLSGEALQMIAGPTYAGPID